MAYIGKEPAKFGQRPVEDVFTATAGQTAFTLSTDVDYETDIIVSINGVVQTNAAFSLSGRVLTFVSGITLNDVVRVAHHGYKPTTISVANDSIGTQKLADSAVTQVKIHPSVILGGPSIGTIPNFIRTNAKTVTEVITFVGTENGITAGPITFSGNGAVVVTTGSTWHTIV